jgi:hypothetical protein
MQGGQGVKDPSVLLLLCCWYARARWLAELCVLRKPARPALAFPADYSCLVAPPPAQLLSGQVRSTKQHPVLTHSWPPTVNLSLAMGSPSPMPLMREYPTMVCVCSPAGAER